MQCPMGPYALVDAAEAFARLCHLVICGSATACVLCSRLLKVCGAAVARNVFMLGGNVAIQTCGFVIAILR